MLDGVQELVEVTAHVFFYSSMHIPCLFLEERGILRAVVLAGLVVKGSMLVQVVFSFSLLIIHRIFLDIISRP